MLRTMRPFLLTLVCTWIALAAAAIVYSKHLTHSEWILSAALPAFCLESAFYLASFFIETREALELLRPARLQALVLWAAALAPYLVFSLLAGSFHRNAFYLLAGLTAVFSLWHALLPRRLAYDAGFLVIGAAPFLTHVFSRIYISPDPHVPVDILGHLMWIRLGVVALLVLRHWQAGPLSLWPTALEWRIGALLFLASIVPLIAIALAVHDVRYAPQHGPWWRILGLALGYFFGCLWVVAVGEELFFRGVIQRAILTHWRSPVLAVGISAVLYGAAHLWFRAFPNWPDVVVTSVLGIGCGIAYLRTGSVRAPMVTHALVVVAWRMLFK